MGKYSNAFKLEAIKLSDEIGLKKAAAQLGLPYYTLADWRNNSKPTRRKTLIIFGEKPSRKKLLPISVRNPDATNHAFRVFVFHRTATVYTRLGKIFLICY
jgi:transposase